MFHNSHRQTIGSKETAMPCAAFAETMDLRATGFTSFSTLTCVRVRVSLTAVTWPPLPCPRHGMGGFQSLSERLEGVAPRLCSLFAWELELRVKTAKLRGFLNLLHVCAHYLRGNSNSA